MIIAHSGQAVQAASPRGSRGLGKPRANLRIKQNAREEVKLPMGHGQGHVGR